MKPLTCCHSSNTQVTRSTPISVTLWLMSAKNRDGRQTVSGPGPARGRYAPALRHRCRGSRPTAMIASWLVTNTTSQNVTESVKPYA